MGIGLGAIRYFLGAFDILLQTQFSSITLHFNTRIQLNANNSPRSHLPGVGIKLEGGLLKDESGNHLFLCMQRRGVEI